MGWMQRKVYKESAYYIVRNFILALLSYGNVKGRLVVESATSEKDFYYHKAAGLFLSRGIPELNVSHTKVQNLLTEISFVSKKNFDIEEQLADLFSYAGRLKFQNKAESSLTAYEKNILKLLNTKLFKMDPRTGDKKRKFLSKIESFKILP